MFGASHASGWKCIKMNQQLDTIIDLAVIVYPNENVPKKKRKKYFASSKLHEGHCLSFLFFSFSFVFAFCEILIPCHSNDLCLEHCNTIKI